MTTTTNTSVDLEHPYWGVGLVLVLISAGILAFSLGVLARCGGGNGICLSPSTHASGDAGLVAFVVLFIIGIALIATTGLARPVTTQTTTRAPPSPSVTNVFPAAAPAAPQPAVTNVYSAPPAQPTTTKVIVTPPN
jgi:hypothetical protein